MWWNRWLKTDGPAFQQTRHQMHSQAWLSRLERRINHRQMLHGFFHCLAWDRLENWDACFLRRKHLMAVSGGQSSTARKLPVPEKQARIADLKHRLNGVLLEGEKEPSYGLLDLCQTIYETSSGYTLEVWNCIVVPGEFLLRVVVSWFLVLGLRFSYLSFHLGFWTEVVTWF